MEVITPFITFVTSRDAHLVCNSQPQNPVLLRIPRLPGRNRLKWWISPCYKEPTTPKLFSWNFCLATTPLLGYVKTFIEISLRPFALKGFVGERYLMQLFSQQPQTTVDGRNPADQLVWLFILWFIGFYASLSSLVVQNFFHQQYFWMTALIPALDHLVRLNFENAWEATTVLTAFSQLMWTHAAKHHTISEPNSIFMYFFFKTKFFLLFINLPNNKQYKTQYKSASIENNMIWIDLAKATSVTNKNPPTFHWILVG